jgi:hypothetical protein
MIIYGIGHAQVYDLVLEDTTISTLANFEAINTIIAGTGFTVGVGGNTTFRSGNTFTLEPGFTVIQGGIFQGFSNAVIGIEETGSETSQHKNQVFAYPNPFIETTTIHINLVKSGLVKLEVYNSLGQKVYILLNQYMEKGSFSVIWDDSNNTKRATGSSYYCILTTEEQSKVIPLLLLR